MNRSNLVLSALVLFTACGDNGAQPDASQPPDAPGTVGVDGSIVPRAVTVAPSASFGVPPGILSALDLTTMTMQQNLAAGTIGSDPVMKQLGNRLYIVNRGENNVTVLDAATYTLIGQLGTGAGSNPQDVAVVGDKMYIPALGTTGVIVGKATDTTFTTIDLHLSVTSVDTHPDCVAAFAVGTDVYVACENLNSSFSPASVGQLAVIDTTTDTVRAHLDLPVKNPQGGMRQLANKDLVLSTYDAASGCLIGVTPGPTPTAGCFALNSELGGEPTSIATAGTKIWVAYTTNYSDGYARAFDTAPMTFGDVITPASEKIRDIAACPDGKIVVADFTGAGGLRVYSSASELTSNAVAIGLPVGYGNGLACY